MQRILIVEDEKVIREELSALLRNNGYESIAVTDFEDVPETIIESSCDLVLLDINIPNINGEAILQGVRKKSNVPIIMVTSRTSELDEALSISYGADDYVTKPYNPNILLLRVGAVLRRVQNTGILSYEGLDIDVQRGTLRKGDEEIVLTKNEMLIFNCLLTGRGRIVTRDELMTCLWDNAEYLNDNALSVNMSRLRAKLAELGFVDVIDTRKGQGYILL